MTDFSYNVVWCNNLLKVKGDTEGLQELCNLIESSRSKFDFDKVIPYPSLYKEMDFNKPDKSNQDEVLAYSEKYSFDNVKDRLLEIYSEKNYESLTDIMMKYIEDTWIVGADGFNNGGLEWCILNWGTQWYCDESDIITFKLEDDYLLIEFKTAWSSPKYAVEHLASMFPKLMFELIFEDLDEGTAGDIFYVDGKIASRETYSVYSTDNGDYIPFQGYKNFHDKDAYDLTNF